MGGLGPVLMVVGVVVVLVVIYLAASRKGEPATTKQSPSAPIGKGTSPSATEHGSADDVAPDDVRRVAAEFIHKFERSEADVHVHDRNKWRAIVFVGILKFPSEHIDETFSDLLLAADNGDTKEQFSWLESEPSVGSAFNSLPHAASDTLFKFRQEYYYFSQACKRKGTTVEDVAKHALGE